MSELQTGLNRSNEANMENIKFELSSIEVYLGFVTQFTFSIIHASDFAYLNFKHLAMTAG